MSSRIVGGDPEGLGQLLDHPPVLHRDVEGPTTWALNRSVLEFIAEQVDKESVTLETGAGVSTMVFALIGSQHCCICPDPETVERIKRQCQERGISLARVRFEIARSEDALPRLDTDPLDLALIDGSHGFPVPFIDWRYIAPVLRVGGLLLVDDTNIWTGHVLRGFLMSEPEWILKREFPMTSAFEKVGEVQLREWTHQPYVASRSHEAPGRRPNWIMTFIRRGEFGLLWKLASRSVSRRLRARFSRRPG